MRCFGDAPGHAASAHTATSAITGNQYHGEVGKPTFQKKTKNPNAPSRLATPANNGRSASTPARREIFLSSRAKPTPITSRITPIQIQRPNHGGESSASERLAHATDGRKPAFATIHQRCESRSGAAYGSSESAAGTPTASERRAALRRWWRRQTKHAPPHTAKNSSAFW